MRGAILRAEVGYEPRDEETLPPFADGCPANNGGAHAWEYLGVSTIYDPPVVDYICPACDQWASRTTRDERVPDSPIRWALHGPHQ